MAESDYQQQDERGTEDGARDEKWLIKRIQAVVRSGINSDEGEVTDVRQDAYDAYMGEPYGNERDGYSKFVTREVLQAIEWALPALMRVFLGGIKAVEFRPSGPDDVEQAKHETDAVNYWFFDGNPNKSGFIILYVFLKDLLMNPNAYLSVVAMEDREQDNQRLTGLGDDDLAELDAKDADYTIDDERDEPDSATGEPIRVYDVTVHLEEVNKRVEVDTLAGDKVIVDSRHHDLSLETAKAVIVRDEVTLSDIRELGYDLDLDDVKPSDEDVWSDEETNRLFYSDEEDDGDQSDSEDLEADKAVTLHTCYMRVDWDGDGISELRRIVMAGCYICENEPWDQHAVIAGSALPVPHRHVGMGYAELVMDLQQLMTTLMRQLLDNIYAQNIQRKVWNEAAMLSDGSTMDAILDGTTENIMVRGDPNTAYRAEEITPIVAELGQVIETLKEVPQLRTGVAPQLSLDPSVLEKSTMGAFVGALEQASQRLELLARLVAETVLKPAFLKIHATCREHFDKPQQIQVGGEWVTIDPRLWRKRSSMSVNVGLGFNNKQMMLMLLEKLLMMQREAIGGGLSDEKKIYATLEKFIEQANLGHAGTYFLDPSQPGWKRPPPPEDPAMILAKAQAGALQAEAKRKDEELALKKAEQTENAEAAAAKLINDFMGLKGKDALTTAQIAETMAKITQMNRDEKAQGEPAEDSSADEFARAGGLVGDTAGDREAERTSKQKLGKAPDHSADIADIKQRLNTKKRAVVDRDPAGKVAAVRLEDDNEQPAPAAVTESK